MYQRELESLRKEIELFPDNDLLWETRGEIKNSAGTLSLHLIGNLNHFIGRIMKGTDYVRDRDAEFSTRDIPKENIIRSIDQLLMWLPAFLEKIKLDEYEKEYPVDFLGGKRTNHYMLVQLLIHLNYHLGQINYLRRSF